MLWLSHKRQSRNADAHRRREDLAQGNIAGHQSRTGGEDIIDNEQVLQTGRVGDICFWAARLWPLVGGGAKVVVGIGDSKTVEYVR